MAALNLLYSNEIGFLTALRNAPDMPDVIPLRITAPTTIPIPIPIATPIVISIDPPTPPLDVVAESSVASITTGIKNSTLVIIVILILGTIIICTKWMENENKKKRNT